MQHDSHIASSFSITFAPRTIISFLYSAESLCRSFAALVILVLVRVEAHAQRPVRLLDLLCGGLCYMVTWC